MKPYKPVRWPCYIWWKDELKPRRKYLLFGPRDQGSRTASNYGFLIVAKKGTPSWTIEQEKFESRFWFMWIVVPVAVFQCILYAVTDASFAWMLLTVPAGVAGAFACIWTFWPSLRCDVECASRAQEIRARMDEKHGGGDSVIAAFLADEYADMIHSAKNYPFFKAAGWTVEDVYDRILKYL